MEMGACKSASSTLHKMVNKVLGIGDRSIPLIMLQGDGSFGCGGRGEVNVPVKEFIRLLRQGHRRLGRAGVVITGMNGELRKDVMGVVASCRKS